MEKKFGGTSCEENLKDFFYRVNTSIFKPIKSYPDLFRLDAKSFFEFFLCLRGSDAVCERFKNYLSVYECDEIDRFLIVRAGYAFDGYFIAIIPSGDFEKLIISDEVNFEEIILNRGEFYELFEKMAKNFDHLPSSRLI